MAKRRGPYTSKFSDPKQEQEVEATVFAFELLMPEEFVRKEAERLAPGGFDVEHDPAIEQMADRFRVSTQMMTIRLCQLGFFKALF